MNRDLARISQVVPDLLIIGGGIYGVCAAWDAALRGLSVALVERADFGHATSGNSLRIIHGGLRYLQHGDIWRVRQSIHERRAFMRIAPHLVRPIPVFIPAYGHGLSGREVLAVALALNGVIGVDGRRHREPPRWLPSNRLVSRAEALRLIPDIENTGLTGGAIVYDCQMAHSERLVLAFARSAARAGAQLANYVEATGLLREGSRVVGVRAVDTLTGAEHEIRARLVINASGPWVGRVLDLGSGRAAIRSGGLSKAFNIAVDRQLTGEYAVGVYSKRTFRDRDAILSKGSRLLFITPWQGRSLIGTVHRPYDGDPDDLKVSEDEIAAFLDDINGAYPAAGLTMQNISACYAGLLPAAGYDPGSHGVRLLKRFRIHDHERDGLHGLLSVVGVKFTEARHVAERVIDLAFTKLGTSPPKSATAETALHGGRIEDFEDFLGREVRRRPHGLSPEVTRHLIDHYGSAYGEVLELLGSDPRLAGGVGQGSPVIQAEVVHAVRSEMAQKITDVVLRRTTLGGADGRRDATLGVCAALMARELGWTPRRTQREIDEARGALATRAA
jgi:glycerol-3-phosphate dehydrogenase